MNKNELIDDHDILSAYINNCKSRWDSYAEKEIKKVLSLRRYFYNSLAEADKITVSDSIRGWATDWGVTLSPIRGSLNRAKSDARDQQPTITVTQCVPSKDESKLKLNKAILEKISLNNKNIKNMWAACDSVFDMSLCCMQLIVKSKFNKKSKKIENKLSLNIVPDLTNVYFDCSVPFTNINEDGSFVGINRIRIDYDCENKQKEVNIREHFEKVYEKVTYGTRLDPTIDPSQNKSSSWITEVAVKGVIYPRKTVIEECNGIRHIVFENNELILDERWPYDELPFLIGAGMHLDDFDSDSSNRLTLVPFAEHVVKAQDLLNQAATLQRYNLSQTRGTAKAMYDPEMTKGFGDKWKNRNIQDNDLPYNLLRNPDGSVIPIKPEFIPDTQTSPVVSEIVSSYPGFIQQMLGNEHEETINYNKSGEAIKAAMIIASKNSKLYLDGYEAFLGDLGKRIEHYIPRVYDTPQYVTLDLFGKTQVEEINTREDNKLCSIMEEFEIDIGLGSTQRVSKDKTIQALQQAWMSQVGTPLGMSMVASTIDIYAANIDSEDAPEIARRWQSLLPDDIKKIKDGASEKEVMAFQNQAQQGQQEQMNQQAETAQSMELSKLENERMKAEASLTSAQGRFMSGEASMMKAKADVIKAVEPQEIVENKTVNERVV